MGMGPKSHRSRHTVVCHAAQEAGAPHREYMYRKKEIVIFTLLYLGDPLSDWNQICYRVSRQPGSLHSKFEGNHSSHFRDTSFQSFDFFLLHFLFLLRVFAHLQIAIKCKRVLRSPWAHRKGDQRRILASNLVQIR